MMFAQRFNNPHPHPTPLNEVHLDTILMCLRCECEIEIARNPFIVYVSATFAFVDCEELLDSSPCRYHIPLIV